MNTNLEKPRGVNAPAKSPERKRSVFFNPVFIFVVLVCGSIIGFQVFKNSRTSVLPAEAGGTPADSTAAADQLPDELKPVAVQTEEKPPEWSGVVKRGSSAGRGPGSVADASAVPLSPEAAAAAGQANPQIRQLLLAPSVAKALLEKWAYLFSIMDKQAFLGSEAMAALMAPPPQPQLPAGPGGGMPPAGPGGIGPQGAGS